MSDPLTAAAILALAASQFVGGAAKKAGETVAPAVLEKAGTQIGELWQRIKRHFTETGNQRAESAIAQVETDQSEAALTKLEVYLDDEMGDPAHQEFAKQLQQMAQQIINVEIGEQNLTQQQNTFNTSDTRDNSKVVNVANAGNIQL